MIDLITELKERVLSGGQISQEEAVKLCQIEEKELLYHAADEIREKMCGSHMDLCSIINARSGNCEQDCKWCSQSSYNDADIEKYPLISARVASAHAAQMEKAGTHRYSLVTSGKRVEKETMPQVIGIYKKLKKERNIKLCASMGLLDKESLEQLKEVGVTRYHCNIETAPSYFNEVVTTHTLEEKVQTLKAAQEVGLDTCSGGIIGMGESMEQRIELALTLRDLGVKSVPINILTPVKGTPLENASSLEDEEILTTFAIFRFILPDAKLRLAGGKASIQHLIGRALHAGMNASLIGALLTTTGLSPEEELSTFKEAGFETEALTNEAG